MSLRSRDAIHDVEAHFAQGRVTLRSAEGTVTFVARHAGGAAWLLEGPDGQPRTQVALVARDRAGTWVHVDGRAWLLQRAESRAEGSGAHDGTLVAPMTGKVLEVLVEEGAAVAEGQPLLVLSAMKMRLEIKAPRAGIVKRLPVTAGSQVDGGAILVVVEAEG